MRYIGHLAQNSRHSASPPENGLRKPCECQAHDAWLWRGLGCQPQVAVERVAPAHDVKNDGVELGQVFAIDDIGDVFERVPASCGAGCLAGRLGCWGGRLGLADRPDTAYRAA